MTTHAKNLLLALAVLAGAQTQLHAQGTAFTYQGRLNSGGSPASGLYDYRFKLYADPLGNTQVGSSYITNAIPVTNGLFVTAIDFGAGIFTGSNYWLEVDVKTNLAGGYSVLSPLQGVTPTPYAIFATTASNVSGTVSAAQLSGAVVNGNLPSSPTVSGTVTAGSFAGNGAGVTNVNAATLNGLNAGNFWQLGGNNVAAGQFIGSTNNQPVELWVNGGRVLRLEPGGVSAYFGNGIPNGAPNVIGGSPVNYVVGGVVGAVIGGGGATNYGGASYSYTNSVAADFGIVVGGIQNTIQTNASYSMIGGGYDNTIQANASYSMIGGGSLNQIQTNANNSTIGGGQQNRIQPNVINSAIGGGYQNTIQANAGASLIGGGSQNTIQTAATYSMIGGGQNNTIQTNAYNSAIGGGNGNTIGTNATYSVIPGGNNNAVGNGAQYAFAAGNQAQANHSGTFVWADNSSGAFSSTGTNQFLIRAQGGVGIGATNPITGAALTIRYPLGVPTNSMPGADNGIGIGQYNQFGYKWIQTYGGSLTLNPLGNYVGINTTNPTHLFQVGTAYCDGSAWYPSSDRNLKSGFSPVDAAEILAKVTSLPITRWHYTNDVSTAHVGPMAQDFHAAFATGPDDRHIADVDEGGVALAAIQGLNEKLEAEAKQKDTEITELKARLERLEKLFNPTNK